MDAVVELGTDTVSSAQRMHWSEAKIGRALAQTIFHKHLVVLPNSTWPGFESDLLVVTPDLYLIDVEIKISRQDLKNDASKKKWVADWHETLCRDAASAGLARVAKWPARVWKHYYALPKTIWDKSLLEALPSRQSGVLLLTENPLRGDMERMNSPRRTDDLPLIVDVARHAAPNTAVGKLSHEDVIDISRLSCLRMWHALAQVQAQAEGGEPA